VKLPTFSAHSPARLLSARPAAVDQAFIDVLPPDGFAESYVAPGQFCRIRVQGLEGIFAMFSAPGEPGARFLVRTQNAEGGEAADCMAALPDDSALEMTLPAGEGFGLERARGRDLYFVATGTGIAPVRAAIEAVLLQRGDYGRLVLDHGVRSGGHLAIGDDVERWQAAGVEVYVHASTLRADGSLEGTTVQEALRARAPDLRDAGVVAVGQSSMLRALREDFAALGGDPALFLTNI
jgi:ferredoxin-NADP reductase